MAGGCVYSRYIALCFQEPEIELTRHQTCLGPPVSSPGPSRAPVQPSRPQSVGTQYGPHGLNLLELNMALTASILWNSVWPSWPQSDGTQYGPHGLYLMELIMALMAPI
ncbi:hypothetical protein HAX54_023063 [Datura stramonium]|uniref:Uncharacterized protein n=1 Tax=Datura stramonium TaxID=4076 RepID=A0ABS8UVP9_DATST|nr:hypothetical protein [Datura stramonium]